MFFFFFFFVFGRCRSLSGSSTTRITPWLPSDRSGACQTTIGFATARSCRSRLGGVKTMSANIFWRELDSATDRLRCNARSKREISRRWCCTAVLGRCLADWFRGAQLDCNVGSGSMNWGLGRDDLRLASGPCWRGCQAVLASRGFRFAGLCGVQAVAWWEC